MPQVRDNGIEVPINSDEYNLTADLAKMADGANVVTVVANTTARNALTPFEGRQVFRLDIKQIESYVDGGWRTGTIHNTPLSPAGWSVTGSISVTPEGVKRRVCVDITVTRTGGQTTLVASSWSLIGTVIPSGAVGTSSVKYLPILLTGGTNHITAGAALNPTGALSFRSFSDFLVTTGSLFSLNAVYYI